MNGMFIRKSGVSRMLTLPNGSESPENVNLGFAYGCKVLQLAGKANVDGVISAPTHAKPVHDRYEREFQSIALESEPGRKPHYFFSGDPVVMERMRTLKRGDIVTATGVHLRNGAVRIETLTIDKRADEVATSAASAV